MIRAIQAQARANREQPDAHAPVTRDQQTPNPAQSETSSVIDTDMPRPCSPAPSTSSPMPMPKPPSPDSLPKLGTVHELSPEHLSIESLLNGIHAGEFNLEPSLQKKAGRRDASLIQDIIATLTETDNAQPAYENSDALNSAKILILAWCFKAIAEADAGEKARIDWLTHISKIQITSTQDGADLHRTIAETEKRLEQARASDSTLKWLQQINIMGIFGIDPQNSETDYLIACQWARSMRSTMSSYKRTKTLPIFNLFPCPQDEARQVALFDLLDDFNPITLLRKLSAQPQDAALRMYLAKRVFCERPTSMKPRWEEYGEFICRGLIDCSKHLQTGKHLEKLLIPPRDIAQILIDLIDHDGGFATLATLVADLNRTLTHSERPKDDRDALNRFLSSSLPTNITMGAAMTVAEGNHCLPTTLTQLKAYIIKTYEPRGVQTALNRIFKSGSFNKFIRSDTISSYFDRVEGGVLLPTRNGDTMRITRQFVRIFQEARIVMQVADNIVTESASQTLHSRALTPRLMERRLCFLNTCTKWLVDAYEHNSQDRNRAVLALPKLCEARSYITDPFIISSCGETGIEALLPTYHLTSSKKKVERALMVTMLTLLSHLPKSIDRHITVTTILSAEFGTDSLRDLLSILLDFLATSRLKQSTLAASLQPLVKETQKLVRQSSSGEIRQEKFASYCTNLKGMQVTKSCNEETLQDMMLRADGIIDMVGPILTSIRADLKIPEAIDDTKLHRLLTRNIFSKWAQPRLLFDYIRQHIDDPEVATVLRTYCRAILEVPGAQSLNQLRYEHPLNRTPLEGILSADKLSNWQRGATCSGEDVLDTIPSTALTIEQFKDLSMEDTDKAEQCFMSGEEVGSCQAVSTVWTDMNKALLGHCINGNTRILRVVDTTGRLVGRSVFRLLEDPDGKPALFLEGPYRGKHTRLAKGQLEQAILSLAFIRAHSLELPIYYQFKEYANATKLATQGKVPPKRFDLKSTGGLAPWVYVDASADELGQNSIYTITINHHFRLFGIKELATMSAF